MFRTEKIRIRKQTLKNFVPSPLRESLKNFTPSPCGPVSPEVGKKLKSPIFVGGGTPCKHMKEFREINHCDSKPLAIEQECFI